MTVDTMLYWGDHGVDGRGLPVAVTGVEELLQRAMLRLCIRKGSFGPDPALGSELYRLGGIRAGARERVALSYAQEALLPLPQVSVEEVSCSMPDTGSLLVEVVLSAGGGRYQLEVSVQS